MGCYLGAVVSCGAIVEGVLTWALRQREEDALTQFVGDSKREIDAWDLYHLTRVATRLGLLGQTAERAAWAVKDFRNLVRPHRLLQQSTWPTEDLASSALLAVNEVTRSVRGRVGKAP